MKIIVDDIPEEGLNLELTEQGVTLEALAGGNLDFAFRAPVHATLDLMKAGADVHVNGEIKTDLQFNCSRCLKEFDYAFDSVFNVFYAKGKETDKDKEVKPSEIDVNYFDGAELDTTEIMLAQISLEAPMKPLCREDCAGLCPKCGEDLNNGKCSCPPEAHVDTRFAKLKDFKVK